MSVLAPLPPAPFGFVGPDCAVRATLDHLLAGWHEELAELPPGPVEVVSELRGRRTASGWALSRVSSSLQVGLGGPGTSFSASTLHWSPGAGPARWAVFPDDPHLDGLGPAVAGSPAVLRYLPGRRCTFRVAGTVVTVERRSRVQESFARAAALSAAATASGVPVARLGRLYRAASAITQDDVPGAAMADLAAGPALEPLLAEAGALHAAIHRLHAPSLPRGDSPSAVAGAAVAATGWAAVLTAPDLADDLRRQAGRLAATRVAPGAPVTCHGGFLPSSLIGGPGGWTVVDLELAHCGDPYRDVAMSLAALPADVPALGPATADPLRLRAAEEAYLRGYEERSGRQLDRRRLAWYRAAAELHHLGLAVAEDRWDPRSAARSVALVDGLLEESA